MTDSAAGHLIKMFERISRAIDEAVDQLSELDGAIGDADHGITMVLGFRAVNATLQSSRSELPNASAVMNAAATAFLNAVGASTGPLYATAFRRAAQSLAGVDELDQAGATAMLQAIPAGIRERGKAQRGDKTMLDAWLPASEAAALALANGVDRRTFWQEVRRRSRAWRRSHLAPWWRRRGVPRGSAGDRSATWIRARPPRSSSSAPWQRHFQAKASELDQPAEPLWYEVGGLQPKSCLYRNYGAWDLDTRRPRPTAGS